MNKLILFFLLIGVFFSSFNEFLPFGVNISIFDLILMMCFGLVFIVKSINFDGHIRKNGSIEYTFLFLFIVGCVLSTFYATSSLESISIVVQYLFAIYVQKIIITHVLENSKDYQKNLLKFLNVYLFSSAIVLGIGLLAVANLLPNSSEFFSVGRLESIKGNANALAKYIVYCLPLMFAFIDMKRKTISMYILIGMSIVTIFSTASFGGMIYAIVTVIYYFTAKLLFISKPLIPKKGDILIKKSFFNLRSIMVAVFLVIIVFYTLENPPEKFAERVLTANDLSEAGSASLKLNLMKESIQFITSNPFTGIGLGDYSIVSSFGTNVHNLYLLIFAESGLFGFIGLFGLLTTIFIKSLKILKNVDYQTKFIVLGLNSSLFAVLISITTNTHTYTRPTWFLIILLWVLVEILSKQKEATTT